MLLQKCSSHRTLVTVNTARQNVDINITPAAIYTLIISLSVIPAMDDRVLVLPLLNPRAQGRRTDSVQWSTIWRIIARRRLKCFFLSAAISTILIFTIIHRLTYTKHHVNPHDKAQVILQDKSARFSARTMKTIIGKYVGPKPPWQESTGNISDEALNANNYNPDPESGQQGRPVYLPGYPKDQMKALFSINRFNLVVSDKISVDRKLPDPRKLACKKIHYNLDELPSTSLIIVFHNEAWSTLARTAHSVLNTAPQHLLSEIILVDDASDREFLGKPLEYYMNNLSSIRGVVINILRSEERIGLIKARLLGVKAAKGKVLTFIDAHCEATNGWLEPLLDQVRLDRTVAACPIIDIINEDTFAYTRSFELHLGAINWGLNFRWYPISRRELVASNGYDKQDGKVRLTELVHPFHSPVMAGGLFSIDREYFNEMGAYDPEMDIWGGENIELSLRLWQCGGKVKIVPCSHVAHIFRKSSPYTFRPGREVGDILYSNLARVAEVWMDDWRDFFYFINPSVNRTLEKVGRDKVLTNIEARKSLKSRLQCKDFSWFLDNVWPEHFFPKRDRFFGKVKQKQFRRCLQRPSVKIGSGQAAVGAVETARCSNVTRSDQLFIFNNKTGFLMTDENICLDSGSDPVPTRQMILAPCSESKRQKWGLTSDNHIKHETSGLCLSGLSNGRVQLDNCDSTNPHIQWTLIEQKW